MNLALAWFGKEWRGQWRLLAAYLGLSLASVAIVVGLLPMEHWQQKGTGVEALLWFVAIGVAGVVLFAAPQLVRGEFAPKDDQFVRRLPGALLPSCTGKLLFVLLASLALPLTALLLGEGVLLLLERPWLDLDSLRFQFENRAALPVTAVSIAGALLLGPWIAAVGMWLPGGRMAVGGLCVLLLLIAIAVVLTMQTCPGLEKTIAWQPWLWAAWPVGALLFAVSWRGRRGGGAGRSAQFGLASLAVCLAAPGGWLAQQTWRYHHPEPQRLVELQADGVTPDGRFALVHGAGDVEWQAHPQFRIDLATGGAEQVGVWSEWFVPASWTEWTPYWGGPRRWWRSGGTYDARLFDLSTGVATVVALREHGRELDLPTELRAAIAADVRANAPLRLPGGRRAWRDGDQLAVEQPDGTVAVRPWPAALRGVFARGQGHGIFATPSAHLPVLYDVLCDRAVNAPKGVDWAWLVRSEWIVRDAAKVWQRFDPDTGAIEPRSELQGAWCHCLLDDDRLLFVRSRGRKTTAEMFAFRPADRCVEAIELPRDLPLNDTPWRLPGLDVDARGRLWLAVGAPTQRWPGAHLYVALDPQTLRAERMPVEPGLAFALVGTTVLAIEDGRRIVRTDWTTGARQVLYPIAEREGR